MLAYVFWHWPDPATEPGRYLDKVLEFHRSLAASPSPGFRGSRVLELAGAPWTPAPLALEDWYLLDDFSALGALNEAAVSGPRRAPHDGAARLAMGGAGGVYRRLAEGAAAAPGRATWFGKPAGVGYPEFLAEVKGGELWQRQLVLGPAPEFCLLGAEPPARAAAPCVLQVRSVFPAGADQR